MCIFSCHPCSLGNASELVAWRLVAYLGFCLNMPSEKFSQIGVSFFKWWLNTVHSKQITLKKHWSWLNRSFLFKIIYVSLVKSGNPFQQIWVESTLNTTKAATSWGFKRVVNDEKIPRQATILHGPQICDPNLFKLCRILLTENQNNVSDAQTSP